MGIQAMIMAGGEGVRLRPMTVDRPKPLVPLLGKPVMGYTLQLLKQHGINNIGVTLCFQPKKIRAAFGDGEREGVHLEYFEETMPLGTAGSIRLAEKQLKTTFFVLSGDGLTDCNLTKALEFHKKKKAAATLVLKRVDVPLRYGVVMTDDESRIVGFSEKPSWSNVYSNQVNTGIYILEPEVFRWIPEGKMQDFGKDVFPRLLKEKLPLYGYEMEGYWCDVGNSEAFLQAQLDLMQGNVNLPYNYGVHPDAKIEDGVHLQGNFYIGKGSVLGKGTVVRNAVIGENCCVGAGAVIENSCLWKNATVGVKGRLEGAVLCEGASLGSDAQLQPGCVLGSGAAMGAHARLQAGVSIWPGLRVPAGAVCRENVYAAGIAAPVWDRDGAVSDGALRSCSLINAYVQSVRPRRVLCGNRNAPALQAVVCGALASAGVQVVQGGWMTEAMLAEVIDTLKMDGGILADENKLIFLDADGNAISAEVRRKMNGVMLSGGGEEYSASPAAISLLEDIENIYLSSVLPEKGKVPLLSKVAVICRDERLRRLVGMGLERMRAGHVRIAEKQAQLLREGEVEFLLSDDGKNAECFTARGRVEKAQLDLLRLKRLAEEGNILFEGTHWPMAAEEMYSLCRADESEHCKRQARRMRDGLLAVFEVCQLLKSGSLESHLNSLPRVYRLCREVDCLEGDKGRILYELRSITKMPYTLNRGMHVHHETGYATIVPDEYRPAIRIFSEAASMETAGELCDFYDREIQKTLKRIRENGLTKS